jgi:hypothetical protein
MLYNETYFIIKKTMLIIDSDSLKDYTFYNEILERDIKEVPKPILILKKGYQFP